MLSFYTPLKHQKFKGGEHIAAKFADQRLQAFVKTDSLLEFFPHFS